ncbi:uncharacterized protein LOC109711310 [Ananas comosus]|uniref:Uncharacterized protein LOC109711310 n=1 Tax=Ananas comosus TaxID=4615 RepID=A0A6P5F1W2_ANACO|nr:uncharacterized protein LOC109711310 [Ananas comosus]
MAPPHERLPRVRKGIKTGFSSSSRSCSRSSNRRALVVWEGQPEFISGLCVRSNSFYAEAITDCLEFIKRTSMPISECAAVSIGQ